MLSLIYPIYDKDRTLLFCLVKSVLGGRNQVSSSDNEATWIKVHEDNEFTFIMCNEHKVLESFIELEHLFPGSTNKIETTQTASHSLGVLHEFSINNAHEFSFVMNNAYEIVVAPTASKTAVLAKLTRLTIKKPERNTP